MAVLHTVNKSPFQNTALDSCFGHALYSASKGASVLLIEEAVYAAACDTALAQCMVERLKRLPIYALGPDLDARGIGLRRRLPGIEVVNYAGFVELAVRHTKVIAWG